MNKSDVCSRFKKIYKMVSTQYQQVIRVFQSDNSGEYVNGPMQEFMQSYGIRHQTSNSYSPQQNGLTERKNRQLLEVVRASLFGMNVPLEYWGEAVKSTAYLINRNSSRVIEFQNPLQQLHNLISVLLLPNLEPRVFGCVMYVHNLKPQRSKLDPRAKRCIFIRFGVGIDKNNEENRESGNILERARPNRDTTPAVVPGADASQSPTTTEPSRPSR
ncbi:hypothetical protein ACLB2K_038501 [Fragaria x ananassa]